MTASVLYDAPGPRSRRRILVGSIVAGIGLIAVIALVGTKLDDQGQFEKDKWAPLLDPGDASFDQVWELMGDALVKTLQAAALAMVFSLIIGTLLAVSRITAAPWYRWGVVGLIELLRGVPVVMAIFFAARVLPEYGVDLSDLWFLVIGLTAYNSVIIAEIVRAGVNSLPRGQGEAAESLGLRRWQVLSNVLLPQAFRVMLPALISQLVVVLKDTSLGFIISYQELVRTAGFVIQNLRNPIQVYLVVAVIFIVINYALSRLAIFVERRLSRSKKALHVEAEAEAAATTVGAGIGAA
jgi:glutamate transport system permease protein